MDQLAKAVRDTHQTEPQQTPGHPRIGGVLEGDDEHGSHSKRRGSWSNQTRVRELTVPIKRWVSKSNMPRATWNSRGVDGCPGTRGSGTSRCNPVATDPLL